MKPANFAISALLVVMAISVGFIGGCSHGDDAPAKQLAKVTTTAATATK